MRRGVEVVVVVLEGVGAVVVPGVERRINGFRSSRHEKEGFRMGMICGKNGKA